MAVLPFLVACIAAVTVTATSSTQLPFQPLPDLFSLTVDDILAGFSTNHFTSADLVSAYIARTAEVQLALRPVIEINPDALLIAQTLDNERLLQNRTRGPLHGVPVLLKDNIGTADQLNTTAGSYALYGSIVPHDATVTANLRAAGAVILGKAGLSEWAFWRGTNNSNGWSARGGQVKGAYYEDQDPSGSSGGSAVAAGLGLTALAVGTDTGGSVIDPAISMGLSVVVPITVVQDSVGPITRTVKDAAYLLSAMAGPKGDPGDNYTNAIPFTSIPNYASYCIASGLQGAKIGIPRNIFPAPINYTESDIQQIDAFNAILPLLASLGANVTDNADYPDIDAYNTEAQFTLALDIGFKHDFPAYMSQLKFNPTGVEELADLLNWTQQFRAEQFPLRSTDFWEDSLASNLTTESPEYLAAIAHNAYLGSNATIQGALDAYGLDALVLPTAYSVRPAVFAGYPVITVPLGYFNATTAVVQAGGGGDPTVWGLNTVAPGIPFGLSFIGPRFGEAQIIQFAYAFERATMVRYQNLPLAKYMPVTQLHTPVAQAEFECPDALGLPK
ncbi:hypothetical protein LTR91_003444 [Friedmanniomyces endolithicus]|uniref:Amidase domain-containing protein n=1 Tax=Friedmanniomyces endolithicus TaxID=329885 RepID=A0AAN6KZG8_9PEZI|nr:hypothetical protein LTR94_001649 [Friedmanniomyces endolithicus]KAK0770630.1 hypothetical protein LTR59_016412 [Friedmanniomyces endolithicus]KAK0793050.1 hypothetical protein LTR75_011282 [Friedmanniomyces endolithicus]KAK0800844.1 hypothetical protein LTR38_007010 [Friedmanniomyces endolithicus]KAK0828817.1 hypothetical protein LTR03_016421 [Friedmanniomyces endolithicus]